jgi:hypothetical protein
VFFESDDEHDIEEARCDLMKSSDAPAGSRRAAGRHFHARLSSRESRFPHPQLGHRATLEKLHVRDQDGVYVRRRHVRIAERI